MLLYVRVSVSETRSLIVAEQTRVSLSQLCFVDYFEVEMIMKEAGHVHTQTGLLERSKNMKPENENKEMLSLVIIPAVMVLSSTALSQNHRLLNLFVFSRLQRD